MRRPEFRKSGLSRLGGVLNSSMESMGLRHKVMEMQVAAKWAEVVGAQIARSSRAERVREGVLFVSCKSSTWASELTFHKKEIIRGLNRAVGGKVVEDIRFSARGFRTVGPPKEEAVGWTKRFEAMPLAEEEAEAASRIAGNTSSGELAEKIRKAVLTSKRRARLISEP